MTWKKSPGLVEATRLLKARKGKPTDADRPSPRPLPGPKRKPLPGQLDLYSNETPGVEVPDGEETPAA